MARFRTLTAWAKQPGMPEAVKLPDETLQEEKKADALLSQIGERIADTTAKAA